MIPRVPAVRRYAIGGLVGGPDAVFRPGERQVSMPPGDTMTSAVSVKYDIDNLPTVDPSLTERMNHIIQAGVTKHLLEWEAACFAAAKRAELPIEGPPFASEFADFARQHYRNWFRYLAPNDDRTGGIVDLTIP